MNTVKYPDWVPEILRDWHTFMASLSSPEDGSVHDADEISSAYAQYDPTMTQQDREALRRRLYRSPVPLLPHEEKVALLDRLTSDLRMREVWRSLARRVQDKREYLNFVTACELGITGWRGSQKLTASEHKALYQEISDVAKQLRWLLRQASGFDRYSICELVDPRTWQLPYSLFPDETDPEIEMSFMRSHFQLGQPSIEAVLRDIAQKATEYAEQEPLVKKPNSANAPEHYFVRTLSEYCKRHYGQPLHEVVAATTAVALDVQDIDADRVRKIVKQ